MQVILETRKERKQRTGFLELLFRSSNCINCKRHWQKTLGKQASKKDRRGDTFFCPNRCGLQRPNEFGCCPICNRQVTRNPTYHLTIKRIELIIDENLHILGEKFSDQSGIINLKDINFKILLPIGKKFYFVPLILIAQFQNLTEKDDIINLILWIQKH